MIDLAFSSVLMGMAIAFKVSMKNKIGFIPCLRKDGKYSLGISYNGKKPNKFVHWIESDSLDVCTCSDPDLSFSLFTKEEANNVIAYLGTIFDEYGRPKADNATI